MKKIINRIKAQVLRAKWEMVGESLDTPYFDEVVYEHMMEYDYLMR